MRLSGKEGILLNLKRIIGVMYNTKKKIYEFEGKKLKESILKALHTPRNKSFFHLLAKVSRNVLCIKKL